MFHGVRFVNNPPPNVCVDTYNDDPTRTLGLGIVLDPKTFNPVSGVGSSCCYPDPA